MPKVSIIIPTNRPGAMLDRCLQAIAGQRCDPGELEVLVVFNGVEKTPQWGASDWPFDLITDRIDEPNICAAKNRALDRARGEWMLFINDDVRVDSDFTCAHLAAHQQLDRAGMVLGRSAWDRYPDETVFDRMIQTTSMVFFYDRMQPHTWYGFRHAWNLNLSVHRRYFETHRFEERLRPVNYDDLELAFRLERDCGLGVWYAPEALCVHDHRYELKGYLKREFRLGRVSTLLWKCNPDCFRAIYNCNLDEAYLDYCRRFVEQEGRFEDQRLAHLGAVVTRRSDELGASDEARAELVQVLYDAHLPLKRLAFRRGVLSAMAAG